MMNYNSNDDAIIPRTPSRWPKILTRFVCSITILAGMTIMIVWSFYYWFPPDSVNVLLRIPPNEALCFILAGVVLWARCEDTKFHLQNLTSLGSGVILLIGFLTLFEYF